MRALGIDYGERRIGLALSDPTGTLASPLLTVKRRRGKRPPLRLLEETARQHRVEVIVAGLPIALDGMETEWSSQVRAVCTELGRRLGIPVHFIDERLTSVQADRALRSAGLPRAKRESKERVDAAAAAFILQRWLDGARPHDCS